MSEAELERRRSSPAWTNEGFLSREHEDARLEAGRETLRRFRAAQLEPGAVIPAYVEREFSLSFGRRPDRGRWDRVDIEPGDATADRPDDPAVDRAPHADTVAPTLELTGRERVTITDYKTSDVRDPAKARQRARESLQLQIYAMAYEAVSGRLPDAVQLHFLDTGVSGSGRGRAEAACQGQGADRGGSGRDQGPRLPCATGSDDLRATPPSAPSARPASPRDVSCRGRRRDHVRLRQHARPGRPVRAAPRRGADRGLRCAGAIASGSIASAFLRVWAEERERQFREEVPRFREVDLAEHLVRIYARLRGGMSPPPAAERWDMAAGRPALGSCRDRWAVDRGLRRRHSSMGCRPGEGIGALLERLAGRSGPRHPEQLAARQDRRPVRRGPWVAAGTFERSSSASASARSSHIRRSSPRRERRSAIRSRAPSCTSETTGLPTWSERRRSAGDTAWVRVSARGDSPLPTSTPDDAVRPLTFVLESGSGGTWGGCWALLAIGHSPDWVKRRAPVQGCTACQRGRLGPTIQFRARRNLIADGGEHLA